MPTHLSAPVQAPKPIEIIKVLVGEACNSQPYLLPKRQLCFYSPYLRTLIEKVEPSQTVCLPDDDPAAFELLVKWMNYEAYAPCHQRGVELEKKIKVQDKQGVHRAFKVWVLAHRLGRPCLILRDECMRYLYEAYTMPPPGAQSLVITPAIALYVFQSARNTNELRHFIIACLARDGMQQPTVNRGCTCDVVLKQVPELQMIMHKTWSGPRKERFDMLLEMEVYMCAPGEVTPGWYQKQAANRDPGRVDGAAWMKKDLRKETD